MTRLYTLGRFELRAPPGALEGLGNAVPIQPKRLALATYLALATPRGFQRRDALVSLFWPDATQDEARNALRQALHHLRQQLGDDAIETRADDQVALVDGRYWCDAVELERAIAAGNESEAVHLYQGSFLDAVFIRGVAPEFEEWVDRTRTQLRAAAAGAAQKQAEREAKDGRIEQAIVATRRRCDMEPDNEAAVRALLSLLDDSGRRADAISEAERFRQLLRQRYDVDPSPETESLIESIRSGTRVPPHRAAAPLVEPTAEPSRDATPTAKRSRWLRAVASGSAAIAIGAVVILITRTREEKNAAPAAPPPVGRIFVTDFTDVTPTTKLGALVASAVRVDLAQSPRLRVLTTAQMRAAVRLMDRPVEVAIDDSVARALAVREGVKGFVTGDVHAVGSTIVLTAHLVAAPTGDELAAAREVARDSADLIPAIERLSRSLRHRIGENVAQVSEALPLSRVTTSSLAALEKYTEGLRLLDLGNRAQSVALLEQAVAIDSGFATAYRMLGSTYNVLGEPGRAAAALGKAFANRSRLTYKERYLVMGSYYRNVTQEYDRAVEAYRQLLALYPDDIAGLNNLGLTLTSLGQHAAAGSLFVRVIAADSTQVNVRLVLAEGMAAQGRFAEARTVLDEATRRFPDNPVIGLTRIYVAAAESDWRSAEQHARRRLESVTASVQRIDALQTLGQIELLSGKLAAAREHLEESMRLARAEGSQRKYLWSAVALGWLDLRYRNRPEDARRRVRRALSVYPLAQLPRADVPVAQLASLYAALGARVEARTLLDMAADSAPNAATAAERRYLRGVVYAAEGRWRDAVLALRDAAAAGVECPICALPELAEAEEQAGNIDAAIAAAERYVRTPFIHRFEPDAAYLATTLVRLARLYERRNQRALAVQTYRRLLDVWREADSELTPQVTAVQRAVALGEGRP